MSCCGGQKLGGGGGGGGRGGEERSVISSRSGKQLDLMYWLCLRQGIQSKKSSDINALVTVIRKLDGRDKLTKIIQYACRFLWWYNMRRNPKSKIGPEFEKMYRTAQMSRKCIHLFRTLEEVDRFQDLLKDQKMPEWRRKALLVKAAAMSIYWLYDNICFFTTIKLLKYDVRIATTRDGAAWSLASAISVWMALYDLKKNGEQRIRLEGKVATLLRTKGGGAHQMDGEGQPQGGDTTIDADAEEAMEELSKVEIRQFDLVGEVVRGVCDFLVAANSPGFDLPLRLTGRRLNDGVIGLAGLLSACSALYKSYPDRPLSRPHRHSLVSKPINPTRVSISSEPTTDASSKTTTPTVSSKKTV